MQWLQRKVLKDIRKWDIDDSIKEILLDFPNVFEVRVGEFEGKITLQNRARRSSYTTTNKKCPTWIEKTI